MSLLSAVAMTIVAGQPNPVALVSEMLSTYHQRVFVSGTIRRTVEVGGKAEVTMTRLQYIRPSRFFLRQWEEGTDRSFLVVCDGLVVSYPLPQTLSSPQPRRGYESVRLLDGTLMEIDGIFALAKGTQGLDFSIPLDIVVNRAVDLQVVNRLLRGFRYVEKRDEGGVGVHVISCQVRRRASDAFSMNGWFFITEGRELRRFVVEESGTLEGRPFRSRITWDVDMKLDVPESIDRALFTIPAQR